MSARLALVDHKDKKDTTNKMDLIQDSDDFISVHQSQIQAAAEALSLAKSEALSRLGAHEQACIARLTTNVQAKRTRVDTKGTDQALQALSNRMRALHGRRYKTDELRALSDAVEADRIALLAANKALIRTATQIQECYMNLRVQVEAGKRVLRKQRVELIPKLEASAPDDPLVSLRLNEQRNRVDTLERRLCDLETSLTLATQTLAMDALLQQTNTALLSRAEALLSLAVPLLRQTHR